MVATIQCGNPAIGVKSRCIVLGGGGSCGGRLGGGGGSGRGRLESRLDPGGGGLDDQRFQADDALVGISHCSGSFCGDRCVANS